jgi:predicted TIM-barrel fold metal-dependent hydrolase
VWIAPYYEDDLPQLAETIGVDKILFGSDWPHGEGLESPVAFTEELAAFGDSDIRKIMRDNAVDLLGVKVGSAA